MNITVVITRICDKRGTAADRVEWGFAGSSFTYSGHTWHISDFVTESAPESQHIFRTFDADFDSILKAESACFTALFVLPEAPPGGCGQHWQPHALAGGLDAARPTTAEGENAQEALQAPRR